MKSHTISLINKLNVWLNINRYRFTYDTRPLIQAVQSHLNKMVYMLESNSMPDSIMELLSDKLYLAYVNILLDSSDLTDKFNKIDMMVHAITTHNLLH